MTTNQSQPRGQEATSLAPTAAPASAPDHNLAHCPTSRPSASATTTTIFTTTNRTAANRVNAKRSTGPRTDAGKARVAQNATRHGLNTIESVATAELADLADRLCLCASEFSNPDAAQSAAEAQAHLVRIRNIKEQLFALTVRRLYVDNDRAAPMSTFEIMAAALLECEPQLLVLDGYERKARSRRKRAFRALWA